MRNSLNDKQRKLAQALAKGMTQHDACKAAGYSPNSVQAAGVQVCRMMENVAFVEYLESIREKAKNKTVADLQEILEFHTGGIRTPIGEVDRESPYCSEEVESQGSYKVKKTSAIEHAKELSRLLGFYAPEKVETTVNDLRDIIARARKQE